MKYSDFVRMVAREAGVSQRETKAVMDSAMSLIKETVKSGDEVILNGVGKFLKKKRSSRVGMNPTTLQRITIPETNTVVFKVSKEFKDHINR